MSTKTESAAPAVSHFATLRNDRDGRVLWGSIVLNYLLPVSLGIIVWLSGFRIAALGEIVGGLSLMAGFLFALVIFVFELRLRVVRNADVQTPVQLPRLVDELFANATYSVVVALLATAATLVSLVTEPKDASGALLGVEPLVSGVLVALIAHLFAMILSCLRRTQTAYSSLKS